MDVSVILCTYNRCRTLAKALESVAGSVLPETTDWEVLVVDNNSNDQTREVVEDFVRRYGVRFRYTFEGQAGKSHALNAGTQQARGRILAFMDDDVVVEPTWLQNLTAHLDSGSWEGAGGRILFPPDFEPPRWLPTEGPDAVAGVLAFFDLGPEPAQLRQSPIGTNMAFLKKVFEKYGGFHTDLGPRPGSEIRGEDIEFGQRLIDAGVRLRYEPSAIVYHPVPENRLNKEYFLRYWFDCGRSLVRCRRPRSPILGIPRQYFSILKMGLLLLPRTLRWVLAVTPQQRFYRKFWVWSTAGAIAEFWRLPNGEKQQAWR